MSILLPASPSPKRKTRSTYATPQPPDRLVPTSSLTAARPAPPPTHKAVTRPQLIGRRRRTMQGSGRHNQIRGRWDTIFPIPVQFPYLVSSFSPAAHNFYFSHHLLGRTSSLLGPAREARLTWLALKSSTTSLLARHRPTRASCT